MAKAKKIYGLAKADGTLYAGVRGEGLPFLYDTKSGATADAKFVSGVNRLVGKNKLKVVEVVVAPKAALIDPADAVAPV